MGDITRLLARWAEGDVKAFEALMPIVYEELRKVADHYLRHERPDHTLQPTALETEVGADAVSTGGMLLRFDPPSGQYIYQWETSSSWTGCRVLQLTLTDGSHYVARFSFR